MTDKTTTTAQRRIWLEIVTPNKPELRQAVDYLVVPTVAGMIGILPGHIPLLAKLATGVLRYQVDGVEHYLAVSEGFLEVTPNKAIVLAEVAELPEQIDVEQALAEKRQAEAELYHSAQERFDFTQVQINLQRALLKLEVARKYGPGGQGPNQ